MSDLLLPIGYIDRSAQMPERMGTVTAAGARGMREAMNLVDMLGGDPRFKPQAPILLVGPDGRTPILLVGAGETEAAELQDMAMEAIGHQDEMVAVGGRGMDYDGLREKHGAVRRDEAGQAISDAIQARIDHHQQNPVSDPFRQPRRPQLGQVFALGGIGSAS